MVETKILTIGSNQRYIQHEDTTLHNMHACMHACICIHVYMCMHCTHMYLSIQQHVNFRLNACLVVVFLRAKELSTLTTRGLGAAESGGGEALTAG